MYGIEYYSKANLLNNANAKKTLPHSIESESVDEPDLERLVLNNNESMDALNENTSNDPSVLTEQLAFKLQHLSKCPDYLIPTPVYTTSNVTLSSNVQETKDNSSLTSTINSNKSSSSCASKYYTDDFILLSEFSEIEGRYLMAFIFLNSINIFTIQILLIFVIVCCGKNKFRIFNS